MSVRIENVIGWKGEERGYLGVYLPVNRTGACGSGGGGGESEKLVYKP